MKIHGLQKMTLLDFPGRIACTVFLGGCDFRCPFCHNADLIGMDAPPLMEETELLDFLSERVGRLDGVAFTGGEPLLRKDLPELLKKIKDMGYLTKIDTNGNHPELLKSLTDNGLADYIAMDIKNSPDLYGVTIGLEGFDTKNIEASIKILLESDADYEFRTTVIRQFHNEDSFRKIGPLIEGAKNYFLQAFVDRESVPFAGLEGFEKEEMLAFADIVRPFVENAEVRGV